MPAPVAAARPAFWATPQYAVAASTLLAAFAVVSGLLFVQNQSLQQGGRDSAPALPGTTRVLQLVAVRGDSGMTIEPAASNEWTVLLADPGFSDFERFDATLTRQPPAGAENGTVVWQAEGLTASFDGFVPVGVPGERLVPGRYALTLQGRSGAAAPETVSLYRFEIDASTP